jgi:PDDEXK-like domain of unknown function (DUF3799)
MKHDTETNGAELLPAVTPSENLIDPSPDEQRVIQYPSMIHDMPAAEYHSRPEISSHDLGRILEAPAKYLHGKQHPKDPTPAMRLGTLTHTAVFEPELLASSVAVLPEDAPARPTSRQRNAKKPSADTVAACLWWDAYDQDTLGKDVITADERDLLNAMHAAVMAHPAASALLKKPGQSEASAFWIDDQTGVKCRMRTDRIIPDMRLILDLKTGLDASPDGFARAVANFGYHRQAARYIDGMRAVTGDDWSMAFIAVEKEAPHLVSVYVLSDAAIEQGRIENAGALKTAAACIASGEWPGYSPQVVVLDLPRWAQTMPVDA